MLLTRKMSVIIFLESNILSNSLHLSTSWQLHLEIDYHYNILKTETIEIEGVHVNFDIKELPADMMYRERLDVWSACKMNYKRTTWNAQLHGASLNIEIKTWTF